MLQAKLAAEKTCSGCKSIAGLSIAYTVFTDVEGKQVVPVDNKKRSNGI